MPVYVFSLFLSFAEKEYQTESNWPENSRRLFLHQNNLTEHRRWTRRVPRPLRWWRAHPTPWARPHPRGPLVAPLTDFLRLYISIYPEIIEEHNRSGVPLPLASVATKNLSGARSGTLPEGESITGGHLHHPGALHDEEGVVHPRGWGYVPVAMCLISFSLPCSWFGTILMYRELCYYNWILWCFSPSTLL